MDSWDLSPLFLQSTQVPGPWDIAPCVLYILQPICTHLFGASGVFNTLALMSSQMVDLPNYDPIACVPSNQWFIFDYELQNFGGSESYVPNTQKSAQSIVLLNGEICHHMFLYANG
jgi:hypothetical protein